MNGGQRLFFGERERRYKILFMSAELIANALISPQRHQIEVRGVKVDGIPEGVEIDAVFWDDNRQAFGLRIWHASFDIVDPAVMIPEVKVTCSVEVLRVAPEAVKFREFF